MRNHTKYLALYYILAMITGLYGLFITLTSKKMDYGTYFKIVESEGVFSFNAFSLIVNIISILVLFISIITIIQALRGKIKKYHLIFPIYFILWSIMWFAIMPYVMSKNCVASTIDFEMYKTCYVNKLNESLKFEIIFDIINTIFPLFFLYKLFKGKTIQKNIRARK
ncbi:MAG: hypothetical protein ABII01_02715 [Candidatus Woesearchaeota archaeon]